MLFEMEQELESISMDYLYDGLVAQDNIYNHSGKLLLVAKGITLNEIMLKRLRKFNDAQQNIKVPAALRKELTATRQPPKPKQLEFENETGYSNIKYQTMSIMAISRISNQVPYEQVSDAGEMVIEHIDTTDPAIILQWINMYKEVDEYLYRHSTNVSILNGLMGTWLGLSEKEIEELVLLGLVHDIGKTRVPASILKSPVELSGEEFEIVKQHPVHSYEMLEDNDRFSEEVKKGARHHHEKMNGSGYPDGLIMYDIPLYARITAVSNTYDTMVSERQYKQAESPFKILSRLRNEQFAELDLNLIKVFEQQMPKELVGKPVLMSDGSAGIVRFIDDRNIEYPLVEINGQVLMTNSGLYCVSMLIDDPEN
jgi:HD-GYP domain-containing protein (c-di-GMP phosphodiesterase class II)